MNKQTQYAHKIIAHMNELFKDDCEYYINPEDFGDDDNSTAFFHALANIVPTYVYNKLTENEASTLDFNHVANRLCFQFATVDGE